MTRVGTRPIAAFIAAVVLAALFAACGGSSSDSSSTGSDASGSVATDTTAESGSRESSSERSSENGGQSQNSGQDQGGGQSQPPQNRSRRKSVEEVETPLKVSGGGAAQFRTKGGDNSIQEFGDEGDESEAAGGRGSGAQLLRLPCRGRMGKRRAPTSPSQISNSLNSSRRSRPSSRTPAARQFSRPSPAPCRPPSSREITTVDAGSLRHEGEQGFLIYHGAGDVTYAMPLRDEGGTWKVAALSGTTLG